MSVRARAPRLALVAALGGASCGGEPPAAQPSCAPHAAAEPTGDCADGCYDARALSTALAVDVSALDLAAPQPGSEPIGAALFLLTSHHASSEPFGAAEATARVSEIVRDADAILAQCSLHVSLELAEVTRAPARLLDLAGNAEGSWGGHPPEGTPNPDLWNYEQGERLTPEARELFAYGKQRTGDGTLAVFVVRHITYYAAGELAPAGGLSYPPSVYHHADDFPLRNSVLLVPPRGECGALPRKTAPSTLAHEIGHMLLDSAMHPSDPENLLGGSGQELTDEQCARMRKNLAALFGDAPIADPGPPG